MRANKNFKLVTDKNDEEPRFTNETYTVYVNEDLPDQSKLLSVEAIDADFGENGLVKYSLLKQTEHSQSILIDKSTIFDKFRITELTGRSILIF